MVYQTKVLDISTRKSKVHHLSNISDSLRLQIPGIRVSGHPDRDREPLQPGDGGGGVAAAAALLAAGRRTHHAGRHLQRLHGQARDAGASSRPPRRHLPHPRQVGSRAEQKGGDCEIYCAQLSVMMVRSPCR